MLKLSIIILSYRTPDLTIACANSIAAIDSEIERELIIVDNGSGDGSAQKIIKELGDKVKVLTSEHNLGFAGGNNLGASHAQGDIFLFLNSDTLIKNDIFSSCVSALEKDRGLGALSPQLFTPDGQPQMFVYGDFPKLISLILRKSSNKPRGINNSRFISAEWVSGCALFISRLAFEKIGGWDDKFFLYYEDVDLCRRLTQAGFHNAIDKKAGLTHLGGRSLKYNRERKKEYYRSQNYYFLKHHGKAAAIALRLMRLPYLAYIRLSNSRK